MMAFAPNFGGASVVALTTALQNSIENAPRSHTYEGR